MNNYQAQTQGLRFKWSIQKSAKDLVEAARNKQLHHWERMKWWEDMLAKAKADAKEHGIEVIESDAMQYSNTKASFGPRIGIGEKYQMRLNEAFSKVKEHNDLWATYRSWVTMMEGSGDRTYDLDVNDYHFFYSNYAEENVDEIAETP